MRYKYRQIGIGLCVSLTLGACQAGNPTRPSPSVPATALPTGSVSPSALPATSQPSPSGPASALPGILPSALPTALLTPSPALSNAPVTFPSPGSTMQPVNLPAEVTADAAFRTEIVKIVGQILPGVKEEPVLTQLTREHALQLALNPKDTAFKLQATYNPVAQSSLQTRILAQGKYPSDNLLNAYFSDSNRERLLQRFQQQVSNSIGVLPYSHYGVEVVKKDSSWFISLVLYTEIIGLENMALTYAGPQNLLIKGRMLNPNYSGPEGIVTLPDGQVQDLTLTASGDAFEMPLNLTKTGYYSFEINVTGPLGPQPATNFVLAVGVPYPQPDTAPLPSPTPLPALESLRARLLELINQDRQSMGVGVVAAEANLDKASQSHSEEMIAQGYIGHNSPIVGTPQMQANLFGVSELVAQNIAISRTLENSQKELMSSPGHRKTIIKPDWTHVGLGIAAAPDGFLYITQNFFIRRFELQPMPAKLKVGETLQIKGKALKNIGAAGIFVNGSIQGAPIDLAKTSDLNLSLSFSQVGKQNIRVGYSEPPVNNTYQFIFYNNWNIEVVP